ncbi:glycoside hydrolase family 3 protein [Aliiglaciecola lipolytica]|uniref:Beta-glucosidase n=1 Tax=Aliiglaciecola lipolytica E3 TaxID=1127673 RepID=K6YRG7_9ALTE|nr:glycoside hydrolase family 3 N-terminal domain-containing protein [Aliiglaciecola lipolytica]GAC13900.1 beta-glucosidase [Aliiglaciecola lipolytica E3]
MIKSKQNINQQIIANVEALMAKMTLAQKIGQMTQAERSTCTAQDVYQYHLGSVLSAAGSVPGNNRLKDWLEMTDAYWLASMQTDADHLAIPVIYGIDAVHGNNNVKDAVVFPHNIGLGAGADFDLIEQIAEITAKEVCAIGVDWVFSPNLAVAEDYHWGRTYESFSERTDLVCDFAKSMITGLQSALPQSGVLACAKHWIGDGGTLHGVDQGDTILDWQQLEQIHVRPYYQAIEAGALSIMVSFSSWNGEKCHGNRHLLTDILKGNMQFSGILISDMQGIDDLAEDFYIAVAKGVNAGIDMFMVPGNWKQFIEHLISHVELGTVPIERINDAVRRILSVKMAIGLFEKPRPSKRQLANHASFGSKQHRNVARKAVQKSLVLLKNHDHVLPLSKNSRILVTGNSADNIGYQCGGFTISWQGDDGNEEFPAATSIWQGIQNQATNAQFIGAGEITDIDPNQFDVAIVVVGERPYAEGLGDIRYDDDVMFKSGLQINGQLRMQPASGNSLELQVMYPQALQTIKTLKVKGIPVVTILISGRPLITTSEITQSSAFIAAWLPGSEGDGVADVLYAKAAFSGKLGFSWPDNSQSNIDLEKQAFDTIYPVGFGLTYPVKTLAKSAV